MRKSKKFWVDRFWDKVKISNDNDCWEWTAFIGWDGYGYFRPHHVCKTQKAHRISWELKNGKIPEGMCILHKCDNRKCVNFNHLFIGTKKDNTIDMRTKGRGWNPIGEQVKCAKLDSTKVKEIRNLYLLGAKQKELAEKFQVDNSVISMVVNRKSWKHVE